MTEHTQSTSPTDGIAHGLAVAVVEAVQSLAADLSPEAVQANSKERSSGGEKGGRFSWN